MATILIIGSGGREHALAWRCASEGHRVIASPGSDAIAAIADCFPVGPAHADIVALALRERVELVIVGPEEPLVAGLANALRSAEIPTFGPSAAAAQLEGSKAAAKIFMQAHAIPTARHVTVASMPEALAALR
jgi:phosphoribosylamine--glycine ligase